MEAGTPGELEAGTPRALRRDAQRNRERILAAARSAFAEHGLELGVDEVARRAGVGTGTLYRRFPTKRALLAAVCRERFDELAELAREARQADDAWDGFAGFVRDLVRLQAQDRGVQTLLAARLVDDPALTRSRQALAPLVQQLVERAQADGSLRRDLTPEDLVTMLCGCGRVVELTVEQAPDYWKRHVALLLDGLRASAATPLPGPALTGEQYEASMSGWAVRAVRAAHLPPAEAAQG
jgi:AcrR family transcriptional regulator